MIIRICLLLMLFSNANAITLIQSIPDDVLFDLTTIAPTEAGNYLSTRHLSPKNKTLLSIDDIPDTTKWAVYARLANEISGITVKIKRIGDGTGITPPSEARRNYKKIPAIGRKLFSGQGKRLNIPMRTKITNLGVSDGFGTFDTDIIFTVKTL